MFIDDGWVKDKSFVSASNTARIIQEDFKLTGFVCNEEKSIWIPSQIIEWLGSIINSRTGILMPSVRRIENIVKAITSFGSCDTKTVSC